MIQIPLSGIRGSGMFAIIDNSDYEIVSKHSWHLSRTKNRIYPRCSYWKDGKVVNKTLHRVLLDKKDGLVIDHINGNGLDNRRANLRYITQKENTQNRAKSSLNKSGTRGVYLSKAVKNDNGSYKTKEKWVAVINHNGKQLYLGGFKKKEDAIKARKDAEKLYYPKSVV